MKEYEKHIRHSHAERLTLSWCGEPLPQSEWAFESIDHAAYNEGRLVPCPDCLRAVVRLLQGVAPEQKESE